MKQLRGLYAQTFFTFRTSLVYRRVVVSSVAYDMFLNVSISNKIHWSSWL